MANLNTVSIQGRLTATPEFKQTNSGRSVTSFSVAVGKSYSKGNPPEQTADFINCTAWNTTAEFISKYFDKGSQILIRGKLSTRSWTDAESGKKRSSTEVVVEEVYFCGSKSDSASSAEEKPKAKAKAKADVKHDDTADYEEVQTGEDLPF